MGHGEENSKCFSGNFGNLLAKLADLLIPVLQKPEVRYSQNSV
jgi:hypothetical protein